MFLFRIFIVGYLFVEQGILIIIKNFLFANEIVSRNNKSCWYLADDKWSEKADLATWKCEMKEEHVNETEEEINSIKRQIFLGVGGCVCVYVCVEHPGKFVGRSARVDIGIFKLPLVVMQPH